MPLVAPLPKAALAAIITLVAISLVSVPELKLLWRLDRQEFWLAALTAVAVLVVGVIAGIAVVVIISLLLVVRRAATPLAAELVQVPGTHSYQSREAAPDGSTVPGMVLWRFDGPLFFANVAVFRAGIDQAIDAADPQPTVFVIDAESIYDLDSTAVRALLELIDELGARGIRIWLARVKSNVRDYLATGGIIAELGPGSVFLEVGDAVDAFRALAEAPDPS